jgi:SAM-dependent methyltransferase
MSAPGADGRAGRRPPALADGAWRALACPACRGGLDRAGDGARCPACGAAYPATGRGQLDLRLAAPRRALVAVEVGPVAAADGAAVVARLPPCPAPEVDWTGVPLPRHLDAELLSYLPRARGPGRLALDLGCGDAVHRGLLEHAGYLAVDVDHDNPAAQVLGDAHALPFADASVDVVLSVAVLEHLRHPWLAARETFRVLAPGGRLLGTAAFLEPAHGGSFYHPTHLGVVDLLAGAGFRLVQVAASGSWSLLSASATMALFPGLPKRACKALVAPLGLLHRWWWRRRARRTGDPRWSERERVLATSGMFAFVAERP